MPIRSSLIAALALVPLLAASTVSAIPAGDSRVLRFPDICGDHIAFVKGGDIYTVAAAGGMAIRLTSHLGDELYPKFSPDCRWIAFSGEYDGTRQVYAIAAGGGQPRQLTWYNDIGPQPPRGGTDYRILDWTPDGKNIVFRANRVATDDRGGRPYLIPLEGGMETPLAVPETGGGMLSPDGNNFVYTPIDRDFRSWKRYRGGRAQDVWTYDLKANTSKRLTDNPASDNQPMWLGDTIYFTSDRNYTVNLFSISPAGGEPKQLTHFTDFDVLWPSAGGDAIVFENGGEIWRLNPGSGAEASRVPIRVSGDYAQTVPQWKNVAAQIESYEPGKDGKAIVFGARGELFRYDVARKEVRNLSQSPSSREIGLTLSPDGNSVAYLSDASGEYDIYTRPVAGGEAKRISSDGGIWRFPLQFSPDGRHIAYGDKQQRLRIIDVSNGRTVDVDSNKHDDITEYVWSPDGQWLAYTAEQGNGLTRVWIYSLQQGKRWPATEETSSASSPAFDPLGRWLYFVSSRDYNLQFSAYEQNYLYTNAQRLYATSLTSDGAVLYGDEAAKPAAPEAGKKDDKAATAKPLKVEPEGLIARVQAMKAPSGNYSNLQAGHNAVFYSAGPGGRMGGGSELRMLNLDADKEVVLARGTNGFRVIGEGKQVLARQRDKFALLDAKPDQDFAKATLDLGQLQVLVNPSVEWQQEFTDAWRILRDWFYEPGVHGGIERWNTIRDRYAALIPYVSSRQDLDYVLQELVGEANAGHVYVQQGDETKVERRPGGLLGAQIEAANGGFRIAKIYSGENWDDKTRSPLTDAGVKVKVGEYITAVDGVDASSVKNFYQLLQNKGDRMVTLSVNSSASVSGSRDVRVKTITSEQTLRYRDWVNERRAMVDRLSNGRVGYIHVPNTSQDGNKELFRGLLAYHDKEALLIDDRYNGGGFIPDRMIELLSREPLNYWKRRGLDPAPTPLLSHQGPKAMLINGLSSSGGDAFPYYFRKLGLGKIIGTRTWGGLIGISGNPGLADGGAVVAATFRFMGTNGQWEIENEGVSPDIEVIDRPELIAAGRDPSVEKGVEILLQELQTKTPKVPAAPPAPSDFGDPQGSRRN